ncbi:MAG: class I SAM-dependent methyltransferase [Nitrososphaerales archaeon]
MLTSLSERFSAVYRDRVWLNGRAGGSLSGLGSEFENTEIVRKHIAVLLKSIDTRSLLDIGCGDFTWMKEVFYPFNYIGVDIVPDLVQVNNSLYRSEQREFLVMDATHDSLPQADTILCREVLFHLSFRDIWSFVENIRHSCSSYLIATTDNNIKYNADILSGGFRMLNLQKSPFCFPIPVQSIPDNRVSVGRTLSVWKVADLPESRKRLRGTPGR